MNFFLLILFIFISVSSRSFALDVYSFIENNCSIHTGFIVGDEEGSIHVLSMDGLHQIVPKKQIETIVIFSTLQNPISSIHMDPALAQDAKEIYINGDDEPLFKGWPIRYIEDLIIFYDTAGKTHVLELSEVTKIKDVAAGTDSVVPVPDAKPLIMNFTDVNSRCAGLTTKLKNGVGPTRIINDKINVADFLSNFEKGYRKINSYQERTHFYAKPFLYERRSKLGLIVFQSYHENMPALPVYFQWSSGKPYGFQSFNIFGSAPSHLLPIAEPVTAIQSDLKSHFFNASFVGNIAALPAGSSYYVNSGLSGTFPKDIYAANNFNYLAMLGADYGPYSVSFGTYFPIFAFRTKTIDGFGNAIIELREVLASSVSPIFKVAYTKNRLSARLVYSPPAQANGSGNDSQKINVQTSTGVVPDSFQASGWFLRGGVDYRIVDELKVGVDEIYSQSQYSETQSGNAFHFNDTNYTTSAYLSQSFGYYISVKVLFNLFDRSYDYKFPNSSGQPSGFESSYGGAFEFVF